MYVYTCSLRNTEKAVDIHRHNKSEVVYIVYWKADTVELYVPLLSSNTVSCAPVMLKSMETMLEAVPQHKADALAVYIIMRYTFDVMH